MSFSGIGDCGLQRGDYVKHNAIMKELISKSWPVVISAENISNESETVLVYYIAYYLPPALVGKALGWKSANYSLFLWSLIGIYLSMFWLTRLVNSHIILCVVMFIFCGGLDILGHLLIEHKIYKITEHIEWWATIWQYSSNSTLLFYVPQQVIPGWLITGLIMEQSLRKYSNDNLLFLFVISLLWSPMITVGLVPYILLVLFQTGKKGLITFQNMVAAPLIAVVMALFYMSHSYAIPNGWLWDIYPFSWLILIKLLLFYTMEFGAFVMCVRPSRDLDTKGISYWWWVTIINLLFFPLYKIGILNDFTMRASIPSLFVLWVFLLNNLLGKNKKYVLRQYVLMLLLIIGFCPAVFEISRAIVLHSNKSASLTLKQAMGILDIPKEYLPQYVGYKNSFYFQFIAD